MLYENTCLHVDGTDYVKMEADVARALEDFMP